MSRDFVEKRIGAADLQLARKQQKDIAYFTRGEIQEDVNESYIEQWANRNNQTNDSFLNWVKTILKTDNFLTFYKYFRNPSPSSELINDRIEPQLHRVFYSDDSYFKYVVNGDTVETPENLNTEDFDSMIFESLLFTHNDVVFEDLRDINTPFRSKVSINDIVALESVNSIIKRIAFKSSIAITGEDGNIRSKEGFLYADENDYIFYDEKYEPIIVEPHDLGECPADYIANKPFSDKDIVRKSIFSHVKPDLEEFCFLRTLQRMADANGTIPIVTKLGVKEKSKSNEDRKGSTSNDPNLSNLVAGQSAGVKSEISNKGDSILQPGSTYTVPMIKKDDGTLDMDAVKNFLNFFYMPTEALEFLAKRIDTLSHKIIISILGEMNQNMQRKNELDVRSGFVSSEDKLRMYSYQMSRIRERSDFKMLALEFGRERVSNEAFFGSDFFLESQNDLYVLFKDAPNAIERKNIILRLARNRNKFNKDRSKKEVISYHILPFVSDKDFETAKEANQVSERNFQLQTRFNYWIGLFEAEYGDMLTFWESLNGTQSEKIMLINRLLTDIINRETQDLNMIQSDGSQNQNNE
jgi:hypothetical protein